VTERVTAEQMAEWRRLTEAASPPPWVADFLPEFDRWENQVFIAAARTAMPALLAECERLQSRLDYAQQQAQEHGIALVKQTDAALDDRDRRAIREQRLEERLAALLPLARAAVRFDRAVGHLEQVRHGPSGADDLQRALARHYKAHRALGDAVAALDPDLRAELEAGDADTR